MTENVLLHVRKFHRKKREDIILLTEYVFYVIFFKVCVLGIRAVRLLSISAFFLLTQKFYLVFFCDLQISKVRPPQDPQARGKVPVHQQVNRPVCQQVCQLV
jgi:hypothetical protein